MTIKQTIIRSLILAGGIIVYEMVIGAKVRSMLP